MGRSVSGRKNYEADSTEKFGLGEVVPLAANAPTLPIAKNGIATKEPLAIATPSVPDQMLRTLEVLSCYFLRTLLY